MKIFSSSTRIVQRVCKARLKHLTIALAVCGFWGMLVQAAVAVTVDDPNPSNASIYTSAPTGALADSGWQYTGKYYVYNATAIAPNYIITARHLDNHSTFTLGGVTSNRISTLFVPGTTDLSVIKVSGNLSTFAPLYTGSETGKDFVVMGSGRDTVGPVYDSSSNLRGYEIGGATYTQRWGTNTVDSVFGEALTATFNGGVSASEAALTAGDSGGGIFIKDTDGLWKLAGVNWFGGSSSLQLTPGGTTYSIVAFDKRGMYFPGNPTAISGPNPLPDGFGASRISPVASTIAAITNFWVPDSNGNWSTGSNWSSGSAPNGAGAYANFSQTNTATRTVTVDAATTVGTLDFFSSNSFVIAGSNALTFEASSGPSAIEVYAGSHTISAPISAPANQHVEKSGSGTLTISGTQTWGSNSSLISKEGTIVVSSSGGSYALYPWTMGSGTITLNTVGQQLAAMSFQGGTINNVGGASSVLGIFSVESSSTLNVGSSAPVELIGTSKYTAWGGNLNVTGSGTFKLNRTSPTVDIASGGASITVGSSATLELAGPSSALYDSNNSRYVNVVNSGTLSVTGTNQKIGDVTGTGSTTVASGAGTFVVEKNITQHNVNLGSGTTLQIKGNSSSQPSSTVDALRPAGGGYGTIQLDAGTELNIAPGATQNSVVGGLTIAGGSSPTAALDINDSVVIVQYSGTSPISTIRDQIISGFDGGLWDGFGIRSSIAASNLDYAIGYIEASDFGLNNGGTFTDPQGGGDVIADEAVILKLTYLADFDLNGMVDGDDYGIWSVFNGTTTGATWWMGDADYDGDVDGDDYGCWSIMAGAGTSIGLPPLGPVPEPSSIALASLGLAGLVGGAIRRKRRRAA